MRRLVLVAVAIALALAAVVPSAGGAPRGARPPGPKPDGAESEDPFLAKQWALAKIKSEDAWATGATGAGVTIAVIDSGIDLGHEDLASNVVPGTTVCKQASCANGQDDNGHGTHVAGIAAAVKGNGKGIAGVAPAAKLMPVKVLDSEGEGTTDDVAAGIRYAAHRGAKVLNLSLGVTSGVGTVLKVVGLLDPIYKAIDDAWKKGAVVVIAAGNDTFPLCAEPADHPKAVCVGATDNNDLIASYSNSGDIDLTAPGGFGTGLCEDHERDILSTILPASDLDCTGKPWTAGYDTLAGTSMAAPHVSGVAALILSTTPKLTNQGVVDKLYSSVDDLGLPGPDPVYGRGRINACKAVAAVTTSC